MFLCESSNSLPKVSPRQKNPCVLWFSEIRPPHPITQYLCFKRNLEPDSLPIAGWMSWGTQELLRRGEAVDDEVCRNLCRGQRFMTASENAFACSLQDTHAPSAAIWPQSLPPGSPIAALLAVWCFKLADVLHPLIAFISKVKGSFSGGHPPV